MLQSYEKQAALLFIVACCISWSISTTESEIICELLQTKNRSTCTEFHESGPSSEDFPRSTRLYNNLHLLPKFIIPQLLSPNITYHRTEEEEYHTHSSSSRIRTHQYRKLANNAVQQHVRGRFISDPIIPGKPLKPLLPPTHHLCLNGFALCHRHTLK